MEGTGAARGIPGRRSGHRLMSVPKNGRSGKKRFPPKSAQTASAPERRGGAAVDDVTHAEHWRDIRVILRPHGGMISKHLQSSERLPQEHFLRSSASPYRYGCELLRAPCDTIRSLSLLCSVLRRLLFEHLNGPLAPRLNQRIPLRADENRLHERPEITKSAGARLQHAP